MAKNIKTAVKGTQDVLPKESYRWQEVETKLKKTAENFGFLEIRTPVFEHTDLFERSVGDTTDVVNKEMYTFEDKGGRSITLRPEVTASVARSFIEHGLFNEPMPMKAYYVSACYRYEKPQAGRLREFHQFGAEMYGSASYLADAEVIMLAQSLLDSVGVKNIKLYINSIGCPECRAKYQEALVKYFEQYKSELCSTCQERLYRNPMRILDCKCEMCKKTASSAPKVIDYLCDDCREHFEGVKSTLDMLGVSYTVNPDIVRGLDYYTRTVFEFVTDEIGAQGTVLGGGRYDRLVEQLNGQPTPSLGFAMGLERLLILLDAQNKQFGGAKKPELYIAAMGDEALKQSLVIVNKLRKDGIFAESDLMNRSVKASMKYADKIGAKRVIVLGDTELESGKCVVKNMADGSNEEVTISEISEHIRKEDK